MENLLEQIAERALLETSLRSVLEGVRDHSIPMPTLLAEAQRGGLDALRVALNDPPLAQAIAEMLPTVKAHRGVDHAMKSLMDMVPAGARLSFLRDAQAITRLCLAYERGEPHNLGPRKRNTVRRYFLRGISHTLRFHLGTTARNQVFDDVQYSGEDDTREVMITQGDIARLLEACDHYGYDDLRLGIRLSLQTSADRGTIFHGETGNKVAPGLRVRQVRIWAEDGPLPANVFSGTTTYSGELYLDDDKTTSRPRTSRLTESLCRELLPYVLGKSADEIVIPLKYSAVDAQWKRVRARATLQGLRFKDLRAQFSIAAERAGVPLAITSKAMGHKAERMTASYQRHHAHLSGDQASAIEQELGLDGNPSLQSGLHDSIPAPRITDSEQRGPIMAPRRVPRTGFEPVLPA